MLSYDVYVWEIVFSTTSTLWREEWGKNGWKSGANEEEEEETEHIAPSISSTLVGST